ncbi:MAG TPA: hypothetical protein VLX85_05305 [Stellaceae bacterium]|nr:hypothetical protein [Stellaceae bacterium]
MALYRGLHIEDFAHGAHGTSDDEGITWLLGEGRALRAEDVFDTRQAWQDALAGLVLEETRRDRRDDVAQRWEPSDIVDEVSDPRHWLIGEQALVIRFVVDGAPSCCRAVAATIPWTRIKPYLRSPLPFSISSN